MRFAINHMVAPRRDHRSFLALAAALGVGAVEIRNDLSGVAILDGTPAESIRAEAEDKGLKIISINALQRFNQWTAERESEARALAAYARAAGAEALVLVPVNDTTFTPSETDRLSGLRQSLSALAPILKDEGLVGLVEPLGFVECSLRRKREAVAAIDAVGAADVFRVVHDTFHHYVAGETEFFPERTGLVHASGVTDPVGADVMRDPHRVLVDAADRIDNVGQIRRLLAGGYDGYVSFEPFSEKVHQTKDIAADLKATMAFVEAGARAADA